MLRSSTILRINQIVNIAYSDVRIEKTTPMQEPVNKAKVRRGKIKNYNLNLGKSVNM